VLSLRNDFGVMSKYMIQVLILSLVLSFLYRVRI